MFSLLIGDVGVWAEILHDVTHDKPVFAHISLNFDFPDRNAFFDKLYQPFQTLVPNYPVEWLVVCH